MGAWANSDKKQCQVPGDVVLLITFIVNIVLIPVDDQQ